MGTPSFENQTYSMTRQQERLYHFNNFQVNHLVMASDVQRSRNASWMLTMSLAVRTVVVSQVKTA